MMAPEERVAALHRRMAAAQRRRERRKTALLGAAGAALTLCLILLVFGGSQTVSGSPDSSFSGSMLFENAGGYTLTAIAAFVVGAGVTLLCLRWRTRNDRSEQLRNETERKQEDTQTTERTRYIPENEKEEVIK